MMNVFQAYYCDIPYVCGTPNIFENGACLNGTAVWQNLNFMKFICDSNLKIKLGEGILDKFPNFTFWMEGIKVTLTARDYMQQYPTNQVSWCWLLIKLVIFFTKL